MTLARAQSRSWPALDLALVATFAALIAVLAVIPAIPIGLLPVPITLQTLGVMITGAVLGPRRGALAVVLYIAVGLVGAPVFAGGMAGVAVLADPSAGYLLSFPFAAAAIGWLTRRPVGARKATDTPWRPAAWWIAVVCIATSIVVIYGLGIAVMVWRTGLPVWPTIVGNAIFLPGDAVKAVLTAVLASGVFRAFPALVGTGRANDRRQAD